MASVFIDFGALDRLTEAKAVKGIQNASLQGERLLKIGILDRPGTGTHHSGNKNPSSAPGSPPAQQTGQLWRSASSDSQVTSTAEGLVGRVTVRRKADDTETKKSDFNVALALEVGTERMAPRPYLSLLATDYRDQMLQAFVAGAKA